MTDDLRYPIGKFTPDGAVTGELRRNWIAQIEAAPAQLRAAVSGLSPQQLDTPYRPGGWTVRQVVHHLADSHLNSYVRFKLALTESEPTIKPYDEAQWAELSDDRRAPVEISLDLLEALHRRWVLLLESFTPADFTKTFVHPELGVQTLESTVGIYAWHGRHHTAQITGLRRRMGW